MLIRPAGLLGSREWGFLKGDQVAAGRLKGTGPTSPGAIREEKEQA